MRVLFGMILGATLIVGAAFISDSWSSGSSATPTTDPSATPATALPHRNMVNWDVVSENMRTASRRAREAWSALSQKVQG
jgi:hypothetical protein